MAAQSVPKRSRHELQAEVKRKSQRSAAYWFAQSTCLEMGTSINTSEPPPQANLMEEILQLRFPGQRNTLLLVIVFTGYINFRDVLATVCGVRRFSLAPEIY